MVLWFFVQILPLPHPQHFYFIIFNIEQYLDVHCTIPIILGSHLTYPTSPPTPNLTSNQPPTPPTNPPPSPQPRPPLSPRTRTPCDFVLHFYSQFLVHNHPDPFLHLPHITPILLPTNPLPPSDPHFHDNFNAWFTSVGGIMFHKHQF